MNVYVLILFVLCLGECKRFTRCKLAVELQKIKIVDNTFLGSWVCLAEKVSNRDTGLLTTKGGKKFYGLYQIPNQWCKVGKSGGDCNVRCEALLDDDIRDDTACAVTIFHREGFKYWKLWETRCKNDNLITSEIYKCPDLISPRTSPDRTYSSDILRYRRMIMLKSLSRSKRPAPSSRSGYWWPVGVAMTWK